jgi:N-acetyl-anhydromuramyl-L-alanine amidase AmpD
MAELWYPPAGLRPGPSWKQYGQQNSVRGVVCHSMVGPTSAALGELYKPSRQASWTFSVSKDGTVLQHYPLNASSWHCGSAEWNTKLVGIEHEGGGIGNESEPLTPEQREASVKLVRWIAEQGGWKPSRSAPKTLYEHNEVSPIPTACPSRRIPWAAYILTTGRPSPELSLDEAFLAIADAYVPAYDRGWDTTFKELPERDGAHEYLLTRRKR